MNERVPRVGALGRHTLVSAGGTGRRATVSEQMHVEVFGDDEEVTFNLNAKDATRPIEIHVDSTSGETTLHATSRDDIQVWLEITGRSAHYPIVTANWDGSRLNIKPAKGAGISRILRGSPGFNVRIEVPRSLMSKRGGRGIVARLASASGEINVGELTGDLRLTTASGDLTLGDVAGLVECHSASGDISIHQITGQLRVNTASGDVSIGESILDRWEVNTVSGSVDSGTVLAGTGPYRVNTVSGDAELRLGVLSVAGRPDAYMLESTTLSGDLEVEGIARKLGKRRWHLGAGERPSTSVRLSSVSGDASVMVEPASIDVDLALVNGAWTGSAWNRETESARTPDRDASREGSKADEETDFASAMGKVDWAGIDQSVNNAIDSAFGRSGNRPPAPAAPAPSAAPVAPATPATPAAPVAPIPPTRSDDLVSDSDAALTPQSPPGLTEDERRLDVLRRIERGELSVEEGMAQLDGPGPARS